MTSGRKGKSQSVIKMESLSVRDTEYNSEMFEEKKIPNHLVAMRITFLRSRDHEQHGLGAEDHSVMPQLEYSVSVCIPNSSFCGPSFH